MGALGFLFLRHAVISSSWMPAGATINPGRLTVAPCCGILTGVEGILFYPRLFYCLVVSSGQFPHCLQP